MRIKKITQIIMLVGLVLIFIGAITFNLPLMNLQFVLVVGIIISAGDTVYYVTRWLIDVFDDRNTRSLYAFVTNSTSITERCRFPIKKKVELHPDVEFDVNGNGDWQKALTGLKNQLREQGIEPDEKGLNLTDEALTACLRLCKTVGFNYIYYVELKRKWIWRNSSSGEGIERFLDLTFRKWGDEYPDANIHDEELFGALSDAEVGLCWLVKWGDAREWVPIYHSKMTLEDAHIEVMLANKALKKMGGKTLTNEEKSQLALAKKSISKLDAKRAKGENLSPEEEIQFGESQKLISELDAKVKPQNLSPEESAQLKKESEKGFKSPADETQIKEGVILAQNAYNSQLSTQDSELRLENGSVKRKLENALDTIERQRQYEEELFDTDIGMPSKPAAQSNGFTISASGLTGIIIAFMSLMGFIGYLLQFTGWFHVK